ncbi:TetR/AcrR family transcriptional regulator [Microbispora hainanensis]|uniref:TetR family transcriptional regulator n=1 Tax=Microbispora hainanensis TaxID=568844 RepID=A0A544Z128_9ACTN|nr:TetR/AcrR family transcriptional regulator [Microbispora hainanensis]TQS22695.1 TetR family transcriptional regulator [Microbispora hainanensis]
MRSQRAVVVADAAIAILAERGMRGLTHRAVDEAAGLPPGSTSNHARTRAALLELTLARLTEREEAVFAAAMAPAGDMPAGAGEAARLADLLARTMYAAITVHRETTIARYELALEATRRPELRKTYDEVGRRIREQVVAALAAAGSPDPVRHGRQMVAYIEGLLFDAIVGAGEVPTLDELGAAFRELLGVVSGR